MSEERFTLFNVKAVKTRLMETEEASLIALKFSEAISDLVVNPAKTLKTMRVYRVHSYKKEGLDNKVCFCAPITEEEKVLVDFEGLLQHITESVHSEISPIELGPFPQFDALWNYTHVLVAFYVHCKQHCKLFGKVMSHILYLNKEEKLELCLLLSTVNLSVIVEHRYMTMNAGLICSNCGKSDVTKCMGCGSVHYCSKKCKKEFSTVHNSQCSTLFDEKNNFAFAVLRGSVYEQEEIYQCKGCQCYYPLEMGVLRCKKCRSTYCSRECQKTDWGTGSHRLRCAIHTFIAPDRDEARLESYLGEIIQSLFALKKKNPAKVMLVYDTMTNIPELKELFESMREEFMNYDHKGAKTSPVSGAKTHASEGQAKTGRPASVEHGSGWPFATICQLCSREFGQDISHACPRCSREYCSTACLREAWARGHKDACRPLGWRS